MTLPFFFVRGKQIARDDGPFKDRLINFLVLRQNFPWDYESACCLFVPPFVEDLFPRSAGGISVQIWLARLDLMWAEWPVSFICWRWCCAAWRNRGGRKMRVLAFYFLPSVHVSDVLLYECQRTHQPTTRWYKVGWQSRESQEGPCYRCLLFWFTFLRSNKLHNINHVLVTRWSRRRSCAWVWEGQAETERRE